MKVVIVFVCRDELDNSGPGAVLPQEKGVAARKPSRSYERYVNERLKSPEYLYIMVGLRLFHHTLKSIRDTWQDKDRMQALAELDELLQKQHELELLVDKIEDAFVREYVYGELDALSRFRRSTAEDVLWDVEGGRCSTL